MCQDIDIYRMYAVTGLIQWFLTWVRLNPSGFVSQSQGFDRGQDLQLTHMIHDDTHRLARLDEKATLPVLAFVPINKLIRTASYKVVYLTACFCLKIKFCLFYSLNTVLLAYSSFCAPMKPTCVEFERSKLL